MDLPAGRQVTKVIPELSRAPPKLAFDRNVATNGFAYLPAKALVAGAQPEDAVASDNAGFDQTIPENDGFFNQDME